MTSIKDEKKWNEWRKKISEAQKKRWKKQKLKEAQK